MKKSYFFVSAILAASILLLLTLTALLLFGYRFSTVKVEGYGRVTYYGKKSGGTVYLEGMTAQYDKAKNALIYSNGDRYEGEIKHYLPNGSGTYYYGDGDVYKGEMKNGVPQGKGTYTFSNGDSIVGIFDRGDAIQGTLTVTRSQKSQSFTGSFVKSNFEGNFSYLFHDGTYYEGGYHNGLPSGIGNMTLANGDTYEGAFLDGVFHGIGIYTFKDGGVLSCTFEKGKPNGYGSYTYVENGVEKIITGQFFDGYYLAESES